MTSVVPKSMRLAASAMQRRTPLVVVTVRSFTKLSAPGPDPLGVLRDACLNRSQCDENGFRVPGAHWVFSVAVSSVDASVPPNLRTLGIQRITESGIDFCVKQGGGSSKKFAAGNAVSILHSHGKYLPGEKAEQWRADGHCEKIPLMEILDKVPSYTITSMVASKRIAMEDHEKSEVRIIMYCASCVLLHKHYVFRMLTTRFLNSRTCIEQDRVLMKDKSHFTEIIQRTRIELENGDISQQELESSIRVRVVITVFMCGWMD